MVDRESQDSLSATLKAAGDPTRRAILTLLAQHGPLRIGDIHARFTISLNAVSKHIKVLERAGLVRRQTRWREHLIEVQLDPLNAADRWFSGLRSIWQLRLDALADILDTGENEDDRPETDG